MDSKEAKKRFPEYKEILEMAGGYKPVKFVQAIEVIKCPAKFNPSGLGDCAYRSSYYVKDGEITSGPSYSYDTMMSSGIQPTERIVDVPKGTRLWVVTYDGIWGGHWEVKVFVHEFDMLESPKSQSKLEILVNKKFDPISEKIDKLEIEIDKEQILQEQAKKFKFLLEHDKKRFFNA